MGLMDDDLSVEAIYRQWAAAFPPEGHREERWEHCNDILAGAVKRAAKRIEADHPEDWAWLLEALSETDDLSLDVWSCRIVWPRIRFASLVIGNLSRLPPEMFPALVRAAVYDPDVSGPKFFLEPCAEVFGAKRMLDAVTDYLEQGTNVERAGAAAAMYCAVWAAMLANDRKWMSLSRILTIVPRTFLECEDVGVRRETAYLMGHIFKESYAADQYRDLIDQVIAVGSNHPDEFVRYCILSLRGTWRGRGPSRPSRSRMETAVAL